MLTKKIFTLAFLIVSILGLLRIDTFEVQAIPITIVASGADYYDRPRINDNDEIVWSQRSNGSYQVWSNIKGQISFGQLDRDPDINNNGEIIWRYGDGGSGPNGISSSIRGNIFSSTGIDPYYDTHRINNVGEIIWTSDRNGGIFSNIRGQLTRNNSGFDRQTAVNDLGDVVSASYSYAQDRNTFDILSTGGGFITNNSAWQLSPDINNMGEIVWGQRVDGASRNSEIWSNLRGRITSNNSLDLNPSINDLGEIVWEHWDGHDYEIFSSVRGQITDNDIWDFEPHISNSGTITWVENSRAIMATSAIPEPSTLLLLGTGLAGIVGFKRKSKNQISS